MTKEKDRDIKEAHAVVQIRDAEIAELNKQIAGLMSGMNLYAYRDAIEAERERARALVDKGQKLLHAMRETGLDHGSCTFECAELEKELAAYSQGTGEK